MDASGTELRPLAKRSWPAVTGTGACRRGADDSGGFGRLATAGVVGVMRAIGSETLEPLACCACGFFEERRASLCLAPPRPTVTATEFWPAFGVVGEGEGITSDGGS